MGVATSTAASAKHATLTADTVDTVTITDPHEVVEILNRGSGTIYAVVAAEGITPADPTVEGDNLVAVPAGMVVAVESPGNRGSTVKLISATADAYSVQAVTG